MNAEVLVVGIDEESLSRFGKWPWSRIITAQFLESIAAYHPRSVLLDFIYSSPERPPFELEKSLDPELRERIVSWYGNIDRRLADAMSSLPDVFIDMAFLEKPEPAFGPEAIANLMAQNGSWLLPWSQPAAFPSNLQFKSFEPVIHPLIAAAKPAPINLLPDPDGVVRSFPLFYTWIRSELESRNIFSVVVNLLRTIYHVNVDDIEIRPRELLLRNATVPMLDTGTREHLRQRMEIQDIEKRLSMGSSPPPIRKTLLQYFLTEGRWGNTQILLKTPIDICILPNGSWSLMDGWELLMAAGQFNLPSVTVRFYHLQDITIPIHEPGMMSVHFGGDPVVLQYLSRNTRAGSEKPLFVSFKEVWEMEPLPELPASDDILEAEGPNEIESWFWSYGSARCNLEGQIFEAAPAGHTVPLCIYMQFLKEEQIAPGSFGRFYSRFGEWATRRGYRDIEPFNESQIRNVWLECARIRHHIFYGRTVLVGGTAKGLGDMHATPYGLMPGISLIANALNTVIQDMTIRFSSDINGLDSLVLFGIGVFLMIGYLQISYRFLPICFLATTGLMVVVSAASFYFHHFFFRTIPILAANFLLSMGMLLFKLITEERDRKFLHATFRSYLAPEVIDEMFQTKSMPTLGGEERIMTAFFSDIAGFTRISETLEPGRLVIWMNEYFSTMTQVLFSEKGTIDKYVGDAIVAFFGAPFILTDHALRACKAALRMQESLVELREKWKRDGCWPKDIEELQVRIGINSGKMVVGNMGSANRMNYTMMGDEVNLASRLESAAKQYGVDTLVSGQTLEMEWTDETGKRKLSDEVEVRLIDNVRVKGKQTPVKIYELMGLRSCLSERTQSLKEHYDRGMRLYQEHQWEHALAAFEESLRWEKPNAMGLCPSYVYMERCRERIAQPTQWAHEMKGDEITELHEK